MLKNFAFGMLASIILLGTIGFYIFQKENLDDVANVLSPLAIKKNPETANNSFNSDLEDNDILNILLLGIDRRSRDEGYRTDIMILLSANKKNNKVVLTSVPRDLWVNGGRVNAVYMQSGWEGMQDAFERITGQKPERFILTDFADFAWVVDAMGGVEVNVERSFVDTEYPEDVTKTYQTISFTQGPEKLTGSRALVFSRSRHGNNGEGSDWMRMRRQHLILRGMTNAVLQPGSIFNPMVVEEAFKTVTTGKMDTNLTLDDAKFLWDFYKDKDKYVVESLFMDSDHVYNPPMSEYGGAWVLAPKNDSYAAFHQLVRDKIANVTPPESVESTPSQQL